MIIPRYSSRHPVACHYLFGNPHVFLVHPESSEKKKSDTATKQQASKDESNGHQELAKKDNAYCLSLDMPGVRSSDAKIELSDGVLTIEAERKTGDKVVAKYVQAFVLNDQRIDESKLQATLSDGILSITIPKKPEAKPILIPVLAEYPPEEKEVDENNMLQISLDLPGVAKDDLKLQLLYDGKIEMHAARKRGRYAGTIEKQFYVDVQKIDPQTFKAYLMDGICTIIGARKEGAPPKKVTVSGEIPEKKTIEANKKEDEEVVVETVGKEDSEEIHSTCAEKAKE
jgi:HSP20 family molecular chaperone IbpA